VTVVSAPGVNQALAQIHAAKDRFTAGERRVADFCVQTFPRIVFETVSSVAAATGTSPPTVMRFAQKAGFRGFADLQRVATTSVDDDWERALDRLHRGHAHSAGAWTTRGLRTDVENLRRTYEGISQSAFDATVALLADPERPVYLAGGEITYGVCLSFASILRWLRDDVHVLGSNAAQLPSELAQLRSGGVMLCFHLRRLTQLLLDVIGAALQSQCEVVVLTNSPTLPLPESVTEVLVLSVEGSGDVIDSYTAAASITNTLAAAVAETRHDELIGRFDRLEDMWGRLHTFIE
jgi:DNA-binding MurR/RpiR family transcriptional regulator